MKSDSSWTLKGRPPDPRETARAGSGRSGISVGDWLNSVVEPAGPEHTPPQADYDDRDEVDDRVPSPRREEIPAPRNHQTWWRRWRGGANPTDAKEPPRRETRRLREPAMAPAPSDKRSRSELREPARGGNRTLEGAREGVGELHGRLDELSKQLQRLAHKHGDAPTPQPSRRPPAWLAERGEDGSRALTGAPLRPRRPVRQASRQHPAADDNLAYGASSIDEVVADIMARQRILDGVAAAEPVVREASAKPPLDQAPAEETTEAAVPARQAQASRAPGPVTRSAESHTTTVPLLHEPLLPDVAFEMAPALDSAKNEPPAQQDAADQSHPVPVFKTAGEEVAAPTAAPPEPPSGLGSDVAHRPIPLAASLPSNTAVAALFAAQPILDIGGLEQQLRDITNRIEALRPSSDLEQAVTGLRADLVEIAHLLTEALPRQAMESLEVELKALSERIDHSRQSGVEADALTGLERGLSEVREALLALTPAENLVGFQEAVQALAQKVDMIVAKDDPATLQQLEAAISGLRGVVSHVASNETLTKVAEDVGALSARVDSLASLAAGGPNLTALENRIDVLANAVTASNEAGQAVPRELEKLLAGLIEKLERIQIAPPDGAAVGQLEDRIARLVQRVDDTDARFGQLETVAANGGLHAVPAGFDAIERDVADIKQNELRTQDSLEAVQTVVEHVVDRLAMIENDLHGAPEQAAPFMPPLAMTMADEEAPPTAPEPEHEFEAPADFSAPIEAPSGRQAPLRKPLDPNLPPDHPLEPGSAAGRRSRPSAADRIAESEAAVAPLKPPVIDDPGGKSNFIAAARRAALAAAAAPYAQVSGTKSAKTTKTPDAAKPGLMSQLQQPRLRTLMLAGVAAVIVLGGLLVATRWFESGGTALPRTMQPETAAPSNNASPQPQPPAASLPLPSAAPGAPQTEPPAAPSNPPPSQKSGAVIDANPPAQTAAQDTQPQTPAAQPAAPAAPQASAPQAAAVTANAAGNSTPTAPQAATPLSIVPPATIVAPADKLPSTISPALRNAAQAGDAAASYEVAMRFLDGRGVAPNAELAAFWLDRAAKQGLAPAEFRLGGMYEKGAGVKKDLAAARDLYLAAAEKGNGKAMHNLAVLYAEGVDGKPNYPDAAHWFREAADRGIVDSEYNLAILYARGVGVDQNYAESYKWFALAGLAGDKDAGKKSDEVSGHLDAQTLDAAKLAVTAWKAKPQPAEAIDVRAPAGGWDAAAAAPKTPKERSRPAGPKAPAAEPKLN